MAANDLVGSVTGGFSGGFGGITTIIQFILWPIILLAGMWLIWWLFSYNIKVHIHNPKDNGSIKEQDKGRFIKDKKSKAIKEFKLLKNKGDWKGSIAQRFLVPTKKAFGRIGYEVYMIRDEEGRLQPILPPKTADVEEWEGMSSSDIAWAMNEIEEGSKVYQQKKGLDQWMPLIQIGGLVIIVVLMIVLFRQMEPLAGAFQNAAGEFAKAQALQGSQVI